MERVFEHDVFIKGLMNIRQIGEHTSAGEMFEGPIVSLNDSSGTPHTVIYLKNFHTAEHRISKAIAKATRPR